MQLIFRCTQWYYSVYCSLEITVNLSDTIERTEEQWKFWHTCCHSQNVVKFDHLLLQTADLSFYPSIDSQKPLFLCQGVLCPCLNFRFLLQPSTENLLSTLSTIYLPSRWYAFHSWGALHWQFMFRDRMRGYSTTVCTSPSRFWFTKRTLGAGVCKSGFMNLNHFECTPFLGFCASTS